MSLGLPVSGIASESIGDYDSNRCHLLSGHYALFLQMFIGITAMSSLVYKRAILDETPRRPFLIWLMDISKQGFSSVLIHFWNLELSIIFSHIPREAGGGADECSFYLINFILDTVLGIFLVWLLLKGVSYIAYTCNINSVKEQGYYGDPPSVYVYLSQLSTFLVVILISKFCLALLLLYFEKPMDRIGVFMVIPFKDDPESELTFVMVVCPCFLNLIQYWVQDNIIMDNGSRHDNYSPLLDNDDIGRSENPYAKITEFSIV